MSGRPEDPDRWALVEELFNQAIVQPPGEAEAFLEQACQGDPALKDRVLALLKADAEADGFLETPAVRLDETMAGEGGASWIGPYRLVRPLGVGGMGEVHLAFEEGPDFERYVAVKIIREGFDPGFSDRFARERAILAQLEHPGIARFHGGGATEDGRPYYVMEYVEGERIDRYADRKRLGIRQRVELFREVSLAVQHAHANLVVHRDLKPDNILVTNEGVPKLLDFGIAKLLTDEQADLTRTSTRLATPAYAAPEQLLGEPVSTASDVYALGVLLYELLSGQRPFSAAQATARAAGSDTGPTPPPSASKRDLKGDLDTIVLKAIRTDPRERYVSAAALADDLTRYLEGRPVLARPTSFGYRARKFVQRHRAASFASAAFILTLIAATVLTLNQNARIQQQADRLAVERDRALEVQGFLLESFGSAGGDDLAGDSLTVRQVLDARADQVESLYSDVPRTRAEMLHVLAEGYQRLGVLEEAQSWAERAVEERRRLSDRPDDPDVARSVGLLGWIHYEQNRLDQAESLIRESLAVWRAIASDSAGLSRALNDLAGVLTTQGQLEEAEAAGREAMAIRRAIYPATHSAIAITANNLGNILGSQGNHEEALAFVQESARVLEETLGPRHRRTLFARRNMAVEYAWLGDWERSAELGRELAAAFEELGGPKDIDLAWALQAYGSAVGRLGRPEEADSLLLRGYGIALERLGDHELTASFLFQRAALFRQQGKRLDAVEQMREAVALYRRLYDDHPRLADALFQQGSLSADARERIESFKESAEILVRLRGEEEPSAVRSTLLWARALLASSRYADALPLFETLERTVQEAFGADHAYSPTPFLGQAEAHVGLGNQERAVRALSEARGRISGSADTPGNRTWLERVEETLPAGGRFPDS
ncbi:MAG: serine/threonine protein kinase [Gemmatimonadetes bacterium]|nr:serine/threonine protein kinase [Gemmatimonadota bacterium]